MACTSWGGGRSRNSDSLSNTLRTAGYCTGRLLGPTYSAPVSIGLIAR